jgi:hypothetical protein
MKSALDAVCLAVVLAVACLLQGCAIGIAKYTGPDIPPKTEITSLRSVPIYIRLCPITTQSQIDIWSRLSGFSPNAFLASEYDLTVKQGEPTPGEQAVYVQVTQGNAEEPVFGIVSGVIHFLSFSLVPGYWTEIYNYNIQVVFMKPDGSAVHHNFSPHLSKQEYLWFPFILKPDIFASINGGIDKSDNPEKIDQAKNGLAGEIVREIQEQLTSAGGVGGWQHASIAAPPICQ